MSLFSNMMRFWC